MTSNTPDPIEAGAFELRGTRSKGSGSGSNGSPNPASDCLKWGDNLQELLNDRVGLKLFQEYLKKEDDDRYNMLIFWIACRGVSQQRDPIVVDQAVRVIYRNSFLKIKCGIKDDVKSALAFKIRESRSRGHDPNNPNARLLLTASIFNDACKMVEKEMNDIMYPNFLRSDAYLKFMQGDQCVMNNNSSCEALAYAEDQEDELPVPYSQTLPVVDEEQELTVDEIPFGRRKSTVKSFSGKLETYPTSTCRPSNLRLYHDSCAPNSELQSVSSGGRTDSLLDLRVDDTAASQNTYTQQRHLQMQKQRNIERQPMSENRTDDKLAYPIIPRTSQPGIREKTMPLQPALFAEELTSKLHQLQMEINKEDNKEHNDELMKTKLRSIDCNQSVGEASAEQEIVRDTFIDDVDQEILDKHVSRIWSDETPRRSPSVGTPVRPKSPDSRRSWSAHPPSRSSSRSFAPSQYSSSYCGSMKHKSKELHSVFSFDSGNYTDPTEGHDNQSNHLYSRVRSVSEYGNSPSEHDYPPSGHLPRHNRPTWTASRRTLTDSGVSDVETGSTMHLYREKNYPSKNTGFAAISEESAMSSSKHRTKSTSGHSRNKSGSSSSSTSSSKNLPGHLFVQDPNIPPFPYHNLSTDINLEETRRRLEVDQNQKLSRSTTNSFGPYSSSRTCDFSSRSGHFSSSSKAESSQRLMMAPRSSHKSYAEESPRGKPVGEDGSAFTHVVYNFSDEQMPYLLKVPGNPITLKQFKDFMPPNKMGKYRYFFVKQCEELNNQPIQEEIIDDNEILPLFRGKVNAQIKAIE